MKPNYILVSIEWVDDLFESYRAIPSWAMDDGDHEGLKILNQLKELPKVDLSEEGIKEKAIDASLEAPGVAEFNDKFIYEQGYQQCAKDLLNTK